MKIGILTLPPSFNYGNILQAWALQTVLERMGNKVQLITIQKELPPRWVMILKYCKRLFYKYLRGESNRVIFEEKTWEFRLQHTLRFVNQNIHIHEYESYSSIQQDEYDGFVVGSDQIWRKRYNPDIRNCYLSFTFGWDVKRVSYAASFGTHIWEYTQEETKDCGKMLKIFNGVSVREKDGLSKIKDFFGMEGVHVLDPTLLLEKSDYLKLLESANVSKSPGDLLCYLLSDNELNRERVSQISSEYGLTPFNVTSRFDEPNAPMSERIQPSVENWLRGFLDAKLIATDSFHATVFSIIFNKPFILFDTGKRGNERLTSLLELAGFDMTGGIFNKIFKVEERNIAMIESLKKQSLDFLRDSLS